MDDVQKTQTVRGKLVLIVDDEPACRLAIEDALRSASHTVHSAETRQEAQELVRRFAYDLVLLDNRLSGSLHGHEGLDILCAIRARTRESKVVLITGYGSPMVQAAALDLGAVRYLEKPVPLGTLLEVLSELGIPSAEISVPGQQRNGLVWMEHARDRRSVPAVDAEQRVRQSAGKQGGGEA